MDIYPIILSGGSGTRLWPLSREFYPKQLLPLTGSNSLLQETVLRVAGVRAATDPILVCNEEHRFMVGEQVRQLDRTPRAILLEPAGRNTAPAMSLAAEFLKAAGEDGIMLVMPADHVIANPDRFTAAVRVGAELAAAGQVITFGIVPTAAETGYGYIQRGAALDSQNAAAAKQDSGRAYGVAAFVEKPDRKTAEQYLASGDYYWNSGIFMARVSVWLAELERFRPDIAKACAAAFRAGSKDGDFYRVDKPSFLSCPSDSIDYAVMEKTDRAVVIPLDAGWSDVGAWPALMDVCGRDAAGNVCQGDVIVHDSTNSMLIAQHRMMAAVGVEDMIVVETADAVLVAHRDKAQDVKKIVDALKQNKREEAKVHRRVYRPWGSYEGIDAGPRFQVKRIIVKPGAALSLQMHHHRAEHWIVVTGTARVTRGEEVFMLTENQSTYIPLGTKHRLENPGTIPLEMIEVQSGSYLGEDDIVRFEDKYNRS